MKLKIPGNMLPERKRVNLILQPFRGEKIVPVAGNMITGKVVLSLMETYKESTVILESGRRVSCSEINEQPGLKKYISDSEGFIVSGDKGNWEFTEKRNKYFGGD